MEKKSRTPGSPSDELVPVLTESYGITRGHLAYEGALEGEKYVCDISELTAGGRNFTRDIKNALTLTKLADTLLGWNSPGKSSGLCVTKT